LLVTFTPTAAVETVSCGATVLASLRLEDDLTCAGGGLVAGADGIEIDLNGHSITGSGSGIGIHVSDRTGVSIRGGTIANFTTGVQVQNSTQLSITGNTFANNGDGVDMMAGSTNTTIKENWFAGSRTRAVMLRISTSHNVVKENRFTANRVGILVFGASATLVKENIIETSGQAGIRVNFQATGNELQENVVTSGPIGLDFIAGGVAGGPVGNVVGENTIHANDCGLNGPFGGNTFSENVFTANGADVCS
jgi:parallel beta-helix repeat protein